ncbi:hypothetical protein OCQ_17090 [Mycobacterium paraintracellulare]|nr:hypothetical protein OCQ_17090 [Mycobacterium paraintracellulare]OSC19129.1 cytochrome P450 [Mycobacterium paraintracellulare]
MEQSKLGNDNMNDLIDTDLSDPEHFRSGPPFEVFSALRERDPVHLNPVGFVGESFWSLTRWEDCAMASKDTDTFSSTGGSTIPGTAALGDLQKLMMVSQDPPHHTARRAIVHKVFTPRTVIGQTAAITAVLNGLLDRVQERGRCDLVADVTAPYPLLVIAEMLGVPGEDQHDLLRWSNAIGQLQGSEDSAGELMTAMNEMRAYLVAFIASGRADPKDDLISKLIHAEVDGQRLTDNELLVSFAELMVAGNETVRTTLAAAIWLLLEHPSEFELLREDPSLTGNAVEEVLRYWTPNVYQARTVTKDVTIGQRTLRGGERIAMWLCSANRDPEIHADPDRFDIRRKDPRHMSFGGGGRHFCLGAGLARLELGIGLPILIERLRGLRFDGDPSIIPHTFFHAVGSVPIVYEPVRVA